ncbi:MAG: glycosyltransferase family 2 protein, partial [Fervidobacterium pennivorans]
ISDTDVAKYISAVLLSETDKNKAKELLENIKEKDKFPFYYYRYAKIFEDSKNQEELELAFKLHLEACIKNKNIADLELGRYPYDGFYPSYTIKNEKSEGTKKIAWVGNISEKHSGLNVISPVRMWLETDEYYYAQPFPSDEALKVYKERLEKTELPRFIVTRTDCIKILNEVNWEDFKILNYFELNELNELNDNSKERNEYEELIQSIYRETGAYYSKESENVLSFDIINLSLDLESTLKGIKKGVFFYFLPDFNNRNNILWYYPYFRIFRTKKQLDSDLKKIGFNNIRHILLTNHLRAVIFER